jgi:hypothetical protein
MTLTWVYLQHTTTKDDVETQATYQRGKLKFSGWKKNTLFIDMGKTFAKNEDGVGEPNAPQTPDTLAVLAE